MYFVACMQLRLNECSCSVLSLYFNDGVANQKVTDAVVVKVNVRIDSFTHIQRLFLLCLHVSCAQQQTALSEYQLALASSNSVD